MSLMLCIATTAAARAAAAGARPSPAAILSRVTAAKPACRDLRCKVRVCMTFAADAPVVLVLDLAAKPPNKTKLVVVSRIGRLGATDFFGHKVGAAYAVDGSALTTFRPFDEKFERHDLSRAAVPATMPSHYGTGDLPRIEHHLAGLAGLCMGKHGPPRFAPRPAGLPDHVTVIAIPLERPAHMWPDHLVSEALLTVDTRRSVVLKAVLVGRDGRVARTTSFGELTQSAQGRWGPLWSETHAHGGKFRSQHQAKAGRIGQPLREVVRKREIPAKGWRIVRRYQWLQGRIRVPEQVECYDAGGQPLYKAVFSHYQVDTGIPDSAFR